MIHAAAVRGPLRQGVGWAMFDAPHLHLVDEVGSRRQSPTSVKVGGYFAGPKIRRTAILGRIQARLRGTREHARSQPAATALAIGCRRVLGAQEHWDSMDVTSLDAEHALEMFENLELRQLKPTSLRDYQQKSRRALAAYVQFLKAQASWSYPTQISREPPSASRQARTDTNRLTKASSEGPDADQRPYDTPNVRVSPFRPDFLATLAIPPDATTEEMNRLIAWVRTLAVDYKGSV